MESIGQVIRGKDPVTDYLSNPEQKQHETNLNYDLRQGLGSVTGAITQGARNLNAAGAATRQAFSDEIDSALSTPASRAAAAAAQAPQRAGMARDVPAAPPTPVPPTLWAGWTPTANQGPGVARRRDDGSIRPHMGRDFGGRPVGTPIFAPQGGQVLRSGNQPGKGGVWMEVGWDDGTKSKILHLQGRHKAFQDGARIMPGQAFAFAGNTGNAHVSNPNNAVLHVEQFDTEGKRIDPLEGGGAGGPTTPFDLASSMGLTPPPAFQGGAYDEARRLEQEAAALEAKPFDISVNYPTLPERPKPTDLAMPDFTKANEIFESTRPISEVETIDQQERIQRQGYFQGMARALASLDFSRNFGLGELFAKVGAGALGGRLAGDEKIDALRREHNQAMNQFNRALASRDEQQMIAATNVLNQNTAAQDNHAANLWMDNIKRIEREEMFEENGTHLITKKKGPNGEIIRTYTPLNEAKILADSRRQLSRIGLAEAAAQGQHEMQVYGYNQSLERAMIPYLMSQGEMTPEQESMMTMSMAYETAAGLAESGTWTEIYGDPKRRSDISKLAYEAAGVKTTTDPDGNLIPPMDGLNEHQQKTFNSYLENYIVLDAIRNKKLHVLVPHQNDANAMPHRAATVAFGARQARDRTTRTTRSNRGYSETVTQR